MEVSEIIRLAKWYQKNILEIEKKYAALVAVLKNNSEQPSQQPVTEPLKELSSALANMPTRELSTLQLRVLEDLDVAELVGERGKQWLNRKVRATTYDPATTYQTIQNAHQTISSARTKLIEFIKSANSMGFTRGDLVDAPTPYVINIIFQKDASVDDIRDWKRTAADWELIFSATAGVAGDKPEDIKVVGASTGSLIFTLSATPIVTKILATISKHIASIANDYQDFQLKRQELERSRMMTKVIRDELNKQESERRTAGKKVILDAVKALVPNAKPDAISKLGNAIEKQIAFSENGGGIDFIKPATLEEDDEEFDEDLADTVNEIRNLIDEYREETQKTLLLTKRNEDDENEF